MNFTKSMLFPMGVALLMGACSPFYPKPKLPKQPTRPNPQHTQKLTPKQERLLRESQGLPPVTPDQGQQNVNLTPSNTGGNNTVTPPQDLTPPTPPQPTQGRKQYLTAAPVPGKEGFVFNPYTHNIVDVKGIPPGKLCRDPEDPDQSHKFRVP